MHNLANLVDEEHNPFLKNLSRISKSSDVAETKDGYAFLTRQEWIYIIALTHIFSDNLGPSLSKADSQ